MYKYLVTIGMLGLSGKKLNFARLITRANTKPDFSEEAGGLFQSYKYCGEGFGVYAVASAGGDPESWGVFADGGLPFAVEGHEIITAGDGKNVICKGAAGGSRIEFRLVNENKGGQTLESRRGASASLSFLALYGKVILPVYKDAAAIAAKKAIEAERRETAARAENGERRASESVAENVKKTALEVWERIRHEDVFSVIESYVMPLGDHSAVYSVLSEIAAAEKLENKYSGAAVWRLTINMNGLRVSAYINGQTLAGEPAAGMRFLGTGLLQGIII